MWSSKNGTKVCGWMGYALGDLRTSSGHGDVWIRVPVQCYTECNNCKCCITSQSSQGFQNNYLHTLYSCHSEIGTLLRVKQKGKRQGRVGELVPRDSFNIIQGCANSGPGGLGIPEVTQNRQTWLQLMCCAA